MYCNVWYGSGAFISGVYNYVFNNSTKDHEVVSTVTNGSYIIRADGSHLDEKQQSSAVMIENIASRKAPTMSANGNQNTTQALIGRTYDTQDLMYGLADDGNGNLTVKITTSIRRVEGDVRYDSVSGLNGSSDTFTNYFRVMSVTTGNGDYLISDTADVSYTGSKANGICYQTSSYADRVGRADDRSSYSNGVFHIYKPATNTSHGQPEQWLDYDMTNQRWTFYKAGTYCFRCFIVDAYGKSATGTVYVAVSRENTTN